MPTRFLNVYPKSLSVSPNAEGVYEGKLIFNLEQYGLVFDENVCDITISRRDNQPGWRLHVHPLDGIEVPHFSAFTTALEHYIFHELNFSPETQKSSRGSQQVQLFFDGIFFDMSGGEATLRKQVVPSVPKPKKR